MKYKFCPLCSKKTEVFYDNLCKECYLKKVSEKLRIKKNSVKIKKCVICGKYYFENSKIPLESFELALKEFLKKIKENAEIIFENGKYWILVEFEPQPGIKISKKFEIKIRFKKIKCEKCMKIMRGYCKGILQVRGGEWMEALNFCERIIKKYPTEFISRKTLYNNGFDLYLSSENILYTISQKLKKKFGYKMKLTKTLLGLKHGKKSFRATIICRKD